MLRFDVTSQVNLALKGSRTEVAGERLEAGVLAAVCDQVGGLAERLAAHATHVRLLSCNATRMRLINTYMYSCEVQTGSRHLQTVHVNETDAYARYTQYQ